MLEAGDELVHRTVEGETAKVISIEVAESYADRVIACVAFFNPEGTVTGAGWHFEDSLVLSDYRKRKQ